jgi:spermidine/putrescine-binding protein
MPMIDGLPTIGTLDRRIFLVGAGALSASALLGAGPAHADTAINWMGWQGYDDPFKSGTFLADNKLTLAPTYINSNEEIITKLQAGGKGQVDLVTIFFGHVPIMIAAGLAEPIDEAKVPALKDVFPEFLNMGQLRKDGKLYAVPYTWGTLSMIYDPAAIPVKPTSWKDVLKDEYKGKVAMADDVTGLITTWAPIAIGTDKPTRLNKAQLAQVIDFLITIKKNHARTFSPSYGEATDLFARGEVVISAIGWDAQVAFAAAKGKKLDYAIPQEGVMGFMDTIVIPAGAPHLEEAYKLLNHAITGEAQKGIAEGLTQAVVTKAALPMINETNKQIYQYGNLAALAGKVKFHDFWPLEADGDFVTLEQVQEEYQRFLKA